MAKRCIPMVFLFQLFESFEQYSYAESSSLLYLFIEVRCRMNSPNEWKSNNLILRNMKSNIQHEPLVRII
eukprot:226656-Amphidinium_carterae.1